MKRYKYNILSGITGSTFQVPIFLEGSVDEMGVMVGFDGEFEQIEQYANFTYKSAYGWAAYDYFPGGFGSESLACSSGVPMISTFYLNEQYSEPTAGQYVYTDKALTTTFNGGYGFFRMQREDGQYFAAHIAPWGQMLSVLQCTPYVSPTPSVTPSESPCPVSPTPTPSIDCGELIAMAQIEVCPVSPTPTPSVTQTLCPGPTPSVTPSIDCGFGVTVDTTPCPSVTPSNTPAVSPSVTPSRTPSVTPSRTPSVTPSETPVPTPSVTPTITPTSTPPLTPLPTPVTITTIYVENGPTTRAITAVRVDGTLVTGGSYPVGPNSNTTSTTILTGSLDIEVDYSGGVPGIESTLMEIPTGTYYVCKNPPSDPDTWTNVPVDGDTIVITHLASPCP